MTLGTTYNNPFNVSGPFPGFAGAGGTIVGAPGQPGYASFPSLQAGWDAGVSRLNQYMTNGYNGSGPLNTIATLNPIYAQDTNWGAGVSRASGIGLNTPLDPNNPTQMAALQRGIVTQEQGAGPANSIFGQVNSGGGSGGTGGDSVTMNPNGTNLTTGDPQDITNIPVQGVNAPLPGTESAPDFNDLPDDTFDTGTVNPANLPNQGTPNLGGGVGQSATDPASIAAGTQGGGAPIDITDLPGLDTSVTGAGKAVQSGATTAGQDVQQAAGGLAGTLANFINSVESYTSSAFIIIALVVLGIIFVAFGLGMFGKREIGNLVPA